MRRSSRVDGRAKPSRPQPMIGENSLKRRPPPTMVMTARVWSSRYLRELSPLSIGGLVLTHPVVGHI
jgi:hypothetical protein